ncbi:MAG: hypothetical protein HC884_04785 [Chloroflexaceae bacterium]|nr:hypothetical protein [Chloroflexaceae bacterium]
MQTPSTTPRSEVDEAIAHICASPATMRRVGHLVRALLIPEEDQLTCEECQDELPEYVQVQEEGRATAPRWRPVALHLDLCPHCTEMYGELRDLVTFAESEQGENPPAYPTFSMPFLQSTTPQKRTWRLDDLGRLIIAFSADLLRTLPPPAQQAAAGAKSAAGAGTAREFALTNEIDDLNVKITMEPVKNDPAHCTVTVSVDIPSRGGWPNLADTGVILKRDESEIATEYTDAFGTAVFEEVATADLEHLVIEIGEEA